MADRRLIAIDWGTTNVRAYRLDGGRIVDRRASRQGVMAVSGEGFRAALDALTAGWRDAGAAAPIVMSGMIGSRQGWVEVPYAACPVDADGLARGLTPVPDVRAAWIVPGVRHRDPAGRHDVMRGEEAQIFGAIPAGAEGRHVLCLPGTHSKWAVVENGALIRFATAMTGEVYQILSDHSILGRLMPAGGAGEIDPDAFRRGLERSGQPGGLLHHLFGVRAEGLFGTVPAGALRAYLSGILIGHEIAGLGPEADAGGPVRLLGAADLARLYRIALARSGVSVETVDAEAATAAGLSRIAAAAGL